MLNMLERIAEELGFQFVIEKSKDGWAITQYLEGLACIETPFLIGKTAAEAKLFLVGTLAGTEGGSE